MIIGGQRCYEFYSDVMVLNTKSGNTQQYDTIEQLQFECESPALSVGAGVVVAMVLDQSRRMHVVKYSVSDQKFDVIETIEN